MAFVFGSATNYITLLNTLRDIAINNSVATVGINAGGSSYTAGDILTAAGGTLAGPAATFEVLTVDGGGAITGIRRLNDGAYSVNPTSPNSATGGTGTGASLTLTFANNGWTIRRQTNEAVSATVAAGGTGYSVNDQLTVVGGVDVEIAAIFNVDTVSAGAVTAVSLVTAGKYGATPANPATTTVSPSGGSGCTLNVTYQVENVTDKYLILEGNGGGADSLFVGIRTFDSNPAFNWELAAFTGFTSTVSYDNQPGVSPGRQSLNEDGAYVPLNNTTIDYWFLINGRRIVGVFKMSTTYTNMYLGWIDPLGTATEFPYPMLVCGCSSLANRLFSVTSIGYRGMPDPIRADGDTAGPGFMRSPGGTWKSVANSVQSGSGLNALGDLIISPNGVNNLGSVLAVDQGSNLDHEWSDFFPTTGNPGTQTKQMHQTDDSPNFVTVPIPCTVIESSPEEVLHGELSGVFAVPANLESGVLVSEDTLVDQNGDVYTIFQNVNSTNVWNFLGIKRTA